MYAIRSEMEHTPVSHVFQHVYIIRNSVDWNCFHLVRFVRDSPEPTTEEVFFTEGRKTDENK